MSRWKKARKRRQRKQRREARKHKQLVADIEQRLADPDPYAELARMGYGNEFRVLANEMCKAAELLGRHSYLTLIDELIRKPDASNGS